MPPDTPIIESRHSASDLPESSHSEHVMEQLQRVVITHRPVLLVDAAPRLLGDSFGDVTLPSAGVQLPPGRGAATPAVPPPDRPPVDQRGFMLGGIRLS